MNEEKKMTMFGAAEPPATLIEAAASSKKKETDIKTGPFSNLTFSSKDAEVPYSSQEFGTKNVLERFYPNEKNSSSVDKTD